MMQHVDKDENTKKSEVDLINESDRGCVIVAAALIDDVLYSLLKQEATFHQSPKKLITSLFESNGALATLSGKASVCRAFGLIDDKILHDINSLRKLRNKFAHDAKEVDFLDNEVLGVVLSMHCCASIVKEWKVTRYDFQSDGERPPDYEIRSKGYLKYGKSVFCLGITTLKIEIYKYEIRNIKWRSSRDMKASE